MHLKVPSSYRISLMYDMVIGYEKLILLLLYIYSKFWITFSNTCSISQTVLSWTLTQFLLFIKMWILKHFSPDPDNPWNEFACTSVSWGTTQNLAFKFEDNLRNSRSCTKNWKLCYFIQNLNFSLNCFISFHSYIVVW